MAAQITPSACRTARGQLPRWCLVDLAHLGEPAAIGGVVTEKCTVLHLRSTASNRSVRIGAMSTPPEPVTPLPHGVFPIGDATDEAEQRAALERQV